ncbi:MAG TPA: DoxX family protein [Candidatus Jorgensenbacteria bacterium]|nr:DoxX family protein [Candidatus Jorgensenbacteria bacterium]
MIPVLFIFSDWALLLIRLVLGVILIMHGVPKLQNIKQTAKQFASMGFTPGAFWGVVVGLIEVLGGIGIAVGLLTQPLALLVFIQFIVILLFVKRGESLMKIETDLLILASAAILTTVGSGALSVDQALNILLY